MNDFRKTTSIGSEETSRDGNRCKQRQGRGGSKPGPPGRERVPCNVVALKARRMCGDSDGLYAHPPRFQRFGKGERLPTRPFGPGFGPPRLWRFMWRRPSQNSSLPAPNRGKILHTPLQQELTTENIATLRRAGEGSFKACPIGRVGVWSFPCPIPKDRTVS